MSTPDETSPRDLAAAYALGALSPEEARAFEAYLAGSPEARREVAELRETAALLALDAEAGVPPAELRERVLRAIRARRAPRRLSIPLAVTGAALAASLAAVVFLGVRLRRMTEELADRERTIAEQAEVIAQQGRQIVADQGTLASILTPGVRLVQLTRSGDPEPRIQLFWDPRHNTAVLHASKLKPTPQGRTYQLWFIRGREPVPSVTFDVPPSGEALVRQITVPAEGDLSAAAVTEEPAGGSQHPTGPILLAGPLPKS